MYNLKSCLYCAVCFIVIVRSDEHNLDPDFFVEQIFSKYGDGNGINFEVGKGWLYEGANGT